jgi:Rrf2 family nitric oxide-sensitive transcriptional repressor
MLKESPGPRKLGRSGARPSRRRCRGVRRIVKIHAGSSFFGAPVRLTVYTDYMLRVLMYLSLRYKSGEVATIDEMATAYGISRSHLTKIVNELAQRGVIETVRGRSGGARLARDPSRISIGEIVRLAEKDFAIVECHDADNEPSCVIYQACTLKRGLRRAVDAFMRELDGMTLADTVTPHVAGSLRITGRPIAIPVKAAGAGTPPRAAKAAAPSPAARRAPRRRTATAAPSRR